MRMDLIEFLKIRAEKYKEKTFLFDEDTPISYRSFDETTDRIGYGL